MAEHSEIQFGLTRIPFAIRRSSKRATVALTIDGGELVVTAPHGASVDRLNAVVTQKAHWVIQRLRRASDRPPPPGERELVDGETVLYLGRQLRLKVIEKATLDEPRDLPRMWAGWYEVPIPRGLPGAARRREVRRRLQASLQEHASQYIPRRLASTCRRLRVPKPSILVCEQKKRWGSCDAKGVLRINWRIIQAPIPLIDYVLVHELTHLVHRAHGADFWAALGRLMPDYEHRRARLRELGPRLEW